MSDIKEVEALPPTEIDVKKQNGVEETSKVQVEAEGKNEDETEGKTEGISEAVAVVKDDEETETTEKNGSSESKFNHNKYDRRKAQRTNSKFDPSVLPETDDPVKIRAQVEFYFGDSNLPTDKFMWDMTDGATNLGVSVSKIASFKRMQRFKPYTAIVTALKDSDFLEVYGPEGKEEVKRKVPYDPKARVGARNEARSIYAKGFGDEEPTTQFDIEAFFSPYGPTNSVRLRRTDDKLFKGSVFVEFSSEELAKKFLELDPKPLWQGKHELQIKSKRDYVAQKEQDIRDGKMEPNETRKPFRGGKEGRGGRGGYRRDRDPDDWKKRREDDQKSGFKGKGGRGGRGRGGRGRGRDDRGPRNDRNRERGSKAEGKAENEKKRPHEDEGGSDEPAAKKVDLKPEAAATEA